MVVVNILSSSPNPISFSFLLPNSCSIVSPRRISFTVVSAGVGRSKRHRRLLSTPPQKEDMWSVSVPIPPSPATANNDEYDYEQQQQPFVSSRNRNSCKKEAQPNGYVVDCDG